MPPQAAPLAAAPSSTPETATPAYRSTLSESPSHQSAPSYQSAVAVATEPAPAPPAPAVPPPRTAPAPVLPSPPLDFAPAGPSPNVRPSPSVRSPPPLPRAAPAAPVDENPYQAPEASVDRPESLDPLANMVLARRFSRLAAQILDGLIVMVPFVILVFASDVFATADSATVEEFQWELYKLLLLALVPVGLINLYFLGQFGQTLGKKALGIKIVRNNGERANLGRLVFLRYGAPGLIGQIPFLGFIFSLLDVLFIFSEERRCIHDHFADTKVVVA